MAVIKKVAVMGVTLPVHNCVNIALMFMCFTCSFLQKLAVMLVARNHVR